MAQSIRSTVATPRSCAHGPGHGKGGAGMPVTANPLDLLLVDGVIDRVVGHLKSGKEAEVYLVEHAGQVVAAKIYKERKHRSFKNSAPYKEGRSVRNTRTQRAI